MNLAEAFADLERTMRASGKLVAQPAPTATAAVNALTLHEPWATIVADAGNPAWKGAGKLVECRTWKTSFRGPLLIHSATAWSARAVGQTLDQLRKEGLIGGQLPDVSLETCKRNTGHVLARAELVRCRLLGNDEPDPWCQPSGEWLESRKPCFGWELRNIVRVRPLLATGAQGLWPAEHLVEKLEAWPHGQVPAPGLAEVERAEKLPPESEAPNRDVNQVEHRRRMASERCDASSPLTIGEMTQEIDRKVHEQDWRIVAILLEHTIGRLDLGEWQANAWVPCPGFQFYRLLAPPPIVSVLDYLRERVADARREATQLSATSTRAIMAGIRQYDPDADDRARLLIERAGL